MNRHQLSTIEKTVESMKEKDAELFERFKRNPNGAEVSASLQHVFLRRMKRESPCGERHVDG